MKLSCIETGKKKYKKKWKCATCGCFCKYYMGLHIRVDPWNPHAGSIGMGAHMCKKHLLEYFNTAMKMEADIE